MKKTLKVIAMLVLTAVMLVNALPVWAETTTAEENTTVAETTTAEEKTTAEEQTTKIETTHAEDTTAEPSSTKTERIYVSIKDKGVAPAQSSPIYIYTGKPIKPAVFVTKGDGTEVDKADYTLEYTGDCINPGNYSAKIVYKKNGYTVEDIYQIIPGTTDKINVKVKDGQVTVSWNPVPGAKVYRVYKYDTIYVNNEKRTGYFEMYWSDGQIASSDTSRTFTKNELKPGGKYKMAIMALPGIEWMPTSQMAYFTVDTTKDTDAAQKPVTLTKPADKPVLITPQPTKPGETAESVATTIKDETVVNPTEETVAVPENEQNAADEVDTPEYDSQENNIEEDEKDPADKTKLIIIIVVILVAVAGIVFSVYKKKK